MPVKTNEATTNLICSHLNKGTKPTEIASIAECHLATVYRIRRNLKLYNSPAAPKQATAGRPEKLSDEILNGLKDFFTVYPTASLREAVVFVKKKYGVSVVGSTLSRGLRKMNIEFKTVRILFFLQPSS